MHEEWEIKTVPFPGVLDARNAFDLAYLSKLHSVVLAGRKTSMAKRLPRVRALCAFSLLFASSLAVPTTGQRAPQQPDKKDIPTLTRDSVKSVVLIVALEAGQQVVQGSGFLVSSDGKVVTNYHVIDGAESVYVKFGNGAYYAIEGVIAEDTAKDLAILKLQASGTDFPFLRLGDSDQLQIGEEVIAIGSPRSLEGTVSNGIVSRLEEDDKNGLKLIQTTVPISHGSSGGALLNMSGEVIGVTSYTLNASGQGLNFAIPASYLKRLLATNTTISPLGPQPGTVAFASDPSGAEVYVDDSFVGEAPTTSELKPGQHAVRMFMNDYQNWVQWITVKPGSQLHLTASLKTPSPPPSVERMPNRVPPTATLIAPQGKPRVFVTDSEAWAAIGGFSEANGTGSGLMVAGSSPQTVEVINDFARGCPGITVTNDRIAADYIVLFDRDAAGKAMSNLARGDKIAVFRQHGDLVYSGKTRSVANAVKDACAALTVRR